MNSSLVVVDTMLLLLFNFFKLFELIGEVGEMGGEAAALPIGGNCHDNNGCGYNLDSNAAVLN